MSTLRRFAFVLALALLSATTLSACSEEIGSKGWCEDMKEKNKADWTATEAKDFAKHCVF